VLKHALAQQRRWYKAGMDIAIAVNLSARTVLDPDLPNVIAGLLAYHEVPGRMLVCEITETTIMTDRDLAHDILTRLSHMGVRISIDDFGTGYSSLAYLKRLPVHEIKIDRSFVTDMLEDRNDAEIVSAIIDLAHNLRIEAVAEGVESKEQLDALAAKGCDMVQGYYISPPIPAKEFPAWHNAAGRNSPAVTDAG
jgi:EAL domain-containing protein (putative c-di-GMP-specific phosphodiesterase class I)